MKERRIMKKTYDINVLHRSSISTPDQLREEMPMTEKATRTVIDSREEIKNILDGKDHRLLIVTGPCSIISERQAMRYGELLAALQTKVAQTLKLVMRTYFEKPRTNVGFKGLISDPHIDKKTFDIDEGLRKARRILLALNEMGVATGTEILSQTAAERLSGLISWACIGARTRVGQRLFHAGGIQERDRRQSGDRHQCTPGGFRAPGLYRQRPFRRYIKGFFQGQPLLPYRFARRQTAQLRSREHQRSL
jgi:3-deoxy-D-arabino-heptulosonate 7-phosphate (DAHP) synthase